MTTSIQDLLKLPQWSDQDERAVVNWYTHSRAARSIVGSTPDAHVLIFLKASDGTVALHERIKCVKSALHAYTNSAWDVDKIVTIDVNGSTSIARAVHSVLDFMTKRLVNGSGRDVEASVQACYEMIIAPSDVPLSVWSAACSALDRAEPKECRSPFSAMLTGFLRDKAIAALAECRLAFTRQQLLKCFGLPADGQDGARMDVAEARSSALQAVEVAGEAALEVMGGSVVNHVVLDESATGPHQQDAVGSINFEVALDAMWNPTANQMHGGALGLDQIVQGSSLEEPMWAVHW